MLVSFLHERNQRMMSSRIENITRIERHNVCPLIINQRYTFLRVETVMARYVIVFSIEQSHITVDGNRKILTLIPFHEARRTPYQIIVSRWFHKIMLCCVKLDGKTKIN